MGRNTHRLRVTKRDSMNLADHTPTIEAIYRGGLVALCLTVIITGELVRRRTNRPSHRALTVAIYPTALIWGITEAMLYYQSTEFTGTLSAIAWLNRFAVFLTCITFLYQLWLIYYAGRTERQLLRDDEL